MNNLIDSSGFWGKVAQYEEIYQMTWILCKCVKHHMITEAKNLVADFFQSSYRPLGPWVEDAHGVSLWSPSINLV